MAEDDARVGGAERKRRLHVVALAQAQHVAPTAANASAPTSTTPAAKSRRLRRCEPSPVSAASGTLHPWVDRAVEQVYNQVRDQHEDAREEDRTGNEWDVEAEHRLHRQPT